MACGVLEYILGKSLARWWGIDPDHRSVRPEIAMKFIYFDPVLLNNNFDLFFWPVIDYDCCVKLLGLIIVIVRHRERGLGTGGRDILNVAT